jgi:hypothetical protein
MISPATCYGPFPPRLLIGPFEDGPLSHALSFIAGSSRVRFLTGGWAIHLRILDKPTQ